MYTDILVQGVDRHPSAMCWHTFFMILVVDTSSGASCRLQLLQITITVEFKNELFLTLQIKELPTLQVYGL